MRRRGAAGSVVVSFLVAMSARGFCAAEFIFVVVFSVSAAAIIFVIGGIAVSVPVAMAMTSVG